jgi:cystathionine beta-lyase family protein involved in aluminum resistance
MEEFEKIDQIVSLNCRKLWQAFRDSEVCSSNFNGSTGYGYDDYGREKLEEVFSHVFKTEAALVRWNFMSGTHAIACVLQGLLRHGDQMVSITGLPYDTLHSVIGLRPTQGSLQDTGIVYKWMEMKNGEINYDEIDRFVNRQTKLVHIQRSRGYSVRKALIIEDIKKVIVAIKKLSPDALIFVDNCYGEFTDVLEPTEVGADVIAGSLIKNPGGGIAPTGGYICGNKDIVNQAASRLTAPGIGGEIGCTLGINRLLYQGFYFAPFVTGEALKCAVYAAHFAKLLGFAIFPNTKVVRGDIVQAIQFPNEATLIAFCQGVQSGGCIDSHISPIPGPMAGYEDLIIMASPGFIAGSSIDISCDAPLRTPSIAYYQGGMNFHYGKLAIFSGFQEILQKEFKYFQ